MADRLDRLLRPTLVVRGRRRSAFRVCGLVGLALALTVCAAVLAARGVALWALPLLGATGVATFLGLALAVKAVSGRETLIYYHHEVAILATCALVARTAGLPVLASLDAVVLGIGAFLSCGRVGCLLVGCCHGRPSRRGVRYGHAHAEAGFPAELVGVRLAPVQAVEAVVAAAITAAGLATVAAGARAGVALLVYVSAYGVARFFLEEWRGDAGRRRLLGFSEAQWTSLGLTALAAWSGPAPHWPAAAAAAAIALAMVALARRPPQVSEVARALLALDEAPAGPVAVSSGRGLLLSGGAIDGEGCRVYAVSGARTARLRELAALVVALRHPAADARLVEGRGGVLHLLVPDSGRRIVPRAREKGPQRSSTASPCRM